MTDRWILIVTNLENQAFIYRNNSKKFSQNNYLKIALEGMGKNSMGIGAKVKVTAGGMTQTQEMFNTRGYQSSVDFNLNFGIGKSKTIDQVEVIWPESKKANYNNSSTQSKIDVISKGCYTRC